MLDLELSFLATVVPCNCRVSLTCSMLILPQKCNIYDFIFCCLRTYTVDLEICWSYRVFDMRKWRWNEIPLCCVLSVCVWVNWQSCFKWLVVCPAIFVNPSVSEEQADIALHTVASIPFQILAQRLACLMRSYPGSLALASCKTISWRSAFQ